MLVPRLDATATVVPISPLEAQSTAMPISPLEAQSTVVPISPLEAQSTAMPISPLEAQSTAMPEKVIFSREDDPDGAYERAVLRKEALRVRYTRVAPPKLWWSPAGGYYWLEGYTNTGRYYVEIID